MCFLAFLDFTLKVAVLVIAAIAGAGIFATGYSMGYGDRFRP